MSLMRDIKFFMGDSDQSQSRRNVHPSEQVHQGTSKEFDMSKCKMSKTSMHPTYILEKDEVSAKVEQKVYRGMIASLLYLTASRPNILFSVCLCARSGYRESHLIVVKKIFRYLKGTIKLGMCYRKSKDYQLVGYCDTNYAEDVLERESTSRSCQFLENNLIS